MIRIPRADLDIQSSFRDIQQELNELRAAIDRLGGSAAIAEPPKQENRLPDDRLDVRAQTLDVFGNADIKGSLTVAGVTAIGKINYYGKDSGGNITTYGSIELTSPIITDGSEEGRFEFRVADGGAENTLSFRVDSYGLEVFGADYVQNNSTGIRIGKYTSAYGYVQAPNGGVWDAWNDNTDGCFQVEDAAGDFYVYNNCSALTFTDRTPYPKDKEEAYTAIKSFEGKDGKLDHNKLHLSVKKVSHHKHINRDPETGFPDGMEPVDMYEPSRNLSATVSALTEVVKDLIARIGALEKKP